MFRSVNIKMTKVSKEVIREFDKDGKVVRERTIINDGGTSEAEAKDRLDKAEKKMDDAFKHMDSMFESMDKMFKDMF